MYIVAENRYAVGDRVKIGEHEGVVHALHLRMTVLIADDGDMIFITNGSITSVVNRSLGESLKAKDAPAGAPSQAATASPLPPADAPAAPAPEPAHDEKTAP